MKVCVDIQAGVAQRAGVGRYTKSLVEHLGPLAGGDELSLFYFDFKRKGDPFPVPGATPARGALVPRAVVQQAWKRLGWPPFDWLAGRADVYHFPNFVLPPLTAREGRGDDPRREFFAASRNHRAAQPGLPDGADRQDRARRRQVITDSQFAARRFRRLLGAPRTRSRPSLSACPTACARRPWAGLQAVRRGFGLERPYLLIVGTIEPRKNIPFLVGCLRTHEGFRRRPGARGAAAGNIEPILERMRVRPRAARIRYLDFVEERPAACPVRRRGAVHLPVLYEGFGFPPLEAMACGTPVSGRARRLAAGGAGRRRRLVAE